ncbi:E3 ubiquitin-protein ligase BRE1 [Spathaspora sp. JA1]|nr:E3 ubiquitin-protein ligase BRE1 [Spathaspora sp. JA1]
MSKRPSESSTPDPSVKRSKPLQELSDSGPLTQEDVVYFQKEAIWRQMTSYRQQVNQLRSEISQLHQDSEKSDRIIKVLIGWYDQIISLFDESGDLSARHDFLILFDDSDDNNDKLVEKRNQLNKILSAKVLLGEEETKKLSEISQQLASSTAYNQQLTQEKKELQARLENSKEKLVQLSKEIHRLQSRTLKRVHGIKEETPAEETPEQQQVEVKQEANGQDDSKVDSSDNQDELAKLVAEVEELKSANSILSEQLEQLNQTHQLSIQKSVELEYKLHNLTEADLESNIHYKKVVKNNRLLQEQISKLSKLNTANISKLNEFEKQQNSIKTVIEKEILEDNENLKVQLAKSEQDLVRIRTTRDDLLGKNSILTSQLQDQKTNQELLDLNKVLTSRIESLTEGKLNEVSSANSPGLADLSTQELISKISQLNNEMKEIESAFKKTREISLKKLESAVDSESLIKKLTIEKTKADQKYFASMRVKDSLSNENKLLKVQVTKAQELIKNLNELETNYLNKIEILTKSLNDYKIIKENSLQENQKLQDTIKTLYMTKETLDAEITRNKQKLLEQTNEMTQVSNEVNKQKLEINKLEKNLKSTESMLQKYKTNNTSSILEEDEQQLEALRSIAKCSVCSKNWKDTAITVCGHVFCSKCTQERLAARLRRCPTCNKGFSSNDLLLIHL